MSYSKQNFRSGDTLYASQLNAMDDEIAVLEAEVESTKNMVGSPLTASTAAGMTDQTKIYVYTGTETGYTAGHWYYYNGTAWTDGGVYNSVAVNTDTSLTVSGQAADSKAVGDAIDDLDSDLSDVKSDLSQLEDATDLLEPSGLKQIDIGTLIANSYVDTDGEFKAYNGWQRTDYISVDIYDYLQTNISTKYAAFYDSDKVLVEQARVYANTPLDVPENAFYFAISGTGANMMSMTLNGYLPGGNVAIIADNAEEVIGKKIIDYKDFELGNIRFSESEPHWTYETNAQMVRTKEGFSYHLAKGSKIELINTSESECFKYCGVLSDGSCIYRSSWSADSFTVPQDGDFVITLTKYSAQSSVVPLVQSLQILLPNNYENINSRFDNIEKNIEDLQVTHPSYKRTCEIYAHQGFNSNSAKLNTVSALLEAQKAGCDGMETDVRQTSDGVLVINHDTTITGTLNGETVTLTIESSTYSELMAVVLYASPVYGDIHINTLEELLQAASYTGMKMLVEYKGGDVYNIPKTVMKTGMQGKVTYMCAPRYWSGISAIDRHASFACVYFEYGTETNFSEYTPYLTNSNTVSIDYVASSNVTPDFTNLYAAQEAGLCIDFWNFTTNTLKCLDANPRHITVNSNIISAIDEYIAQKKPY